MPPDSAEPPHLPTNKLGVPASPEDGAAWRVVVVILLVLFWFAIANSSALAGQAEELTDVFTQDITRFNRLLSSPVAERRVEGLQGLSNFKHWPAEEAIIKLLDEVSPAVRREATLALARLGTANAVPHLIALLSDKSWELRQNAWLGLCRMTGENFPADQPPQWADWWAGKTPSEHEQALLRRLKGRGKTADSAPPVRKATLRALRHLASPSAEAALLDYLQASHKPELEAEERAFIIGALERIGTARAVPVLTRETSDAAAWALGRIGGKEAETALLSFTKTLTVLMNLDRLKSTNAAPFLDHLVDSFGLVTYRTQPDDLHMHPTPIQRVAANLIRRSGLAPDVVELILRELEDTSANPPPADATRPKPLPQLEAALTRLREELKPGFVRGDGKTTSQPLTALYHIANDRALIPRLIPVLRHPAIVPRIYAAMLLGKLQAAEALPVMLEIIREGYDFSDSTELVSGKHFDKSQTVRWRGFFCMALGRMGGEEARLALESLAADPTASRDIRYCSVVGLGFIGSPKSLPVLRRVSEEDIIWMVRDTARQIMADIKLLQDEAKL